MNWFGLLKNKAGKLTLGIPQMVTITGVGLVIAFTAFEGDKKIDARRPVRSLSSISNAYNYGGMQQRGQEGLTSINVKDSLNQVATAEERAQMENARTGGGDFGLSAADNLGGAVGAAFPGAASQTSDTEGLGMGGNEAMDLSAGAAGNAGGVNGAAGANSAQGASGKVAAAGSGNQLGSASMTRASGSGINNTASSGARSFGNVSSGASGGSPSSSSDGYKFSGAMPGGTNPVSLGGLDGRGRSDGMGGARNSSSFGRSSQIQASGNELKDMSRMSAKVAANAFRRSNEGAMPFLADKSQSGGMSVEMVGEDTQSTGSTDLYAAALPEIDRSIKQKQDETQDFEDERNKARDMLYTMLLVMIPVTVLGVAAIKALMASSHAPILGISMKALGWIVAGIVIAACLALVAHAIRYAATYKFGLLSGACMAAGLAGAAWALITAIKGASADATSGAEDAADKAGEGGGKAVSPKNRLKEAVIQAGISSLTPVAQMFGEAIHSDGDVFKNGNGDNKS